MTGDDNGDLSGCDDGHGSELCSRSGDRVEPAAAAEVGTRAVAGDTILDQAKKLTSGDRRRDYGHPLEDFSCTAEIWTAILHRTGLMNPMDHIPAELVALMMTAVKLSRLSSSPGHMDSIVDVAGYMRTQEMVLDKRRGRE